MYSWGHKTQSDFLARATLHWHVEEHEAEEIVSSTCCPPSFVGCRRGEYVPEKQKKTSVDFRFGLWTSFLQSNLTLQLGGATYFGLGGFTPVLNRSNGNQGWLTFFPRNACTRTVTLLLHLLARAAGGKEVCILSTTAVLAYSTTLSRVLDRVVFARPQL